jgi:hypothetical protein
MKLTMLLGAALLSASGALHAQAPQRHFDCSQAKDPKACEERQAKMKAAHDQAKAACESKQGQERRDCMRHEMCAQAKDPKACEARMEKAKSTVAKARQACEGKQGDDRRECMRHELCSQAKDPASCEARMKERAEKRNSAK